MAKNLFSILFLSILFLASCNQGARDKNAANKSDTAKLTVLTFDTSAHSYVDKPVVTEGILAVRDGSRRESFTQGRRQHHGAGKRVEGAGSALFRDPDGNFIELIGPGKE